MTPIEACGHKMALSDPVASSVVSFSVLFVSPCRFPPPPSEYDEKKKEEEEREEEEEADAQELESESSTYMATNSVGL